MASWLKTDPLNPTLYEEIEAFWDDPALLRAAERLDRDIRRVEPKNPPKLEDGGGHWTTVTLLLAFAATGVVAAWLWPELFDRLFSLFKLSA